MILTLFSLFLLLNSQGVIGKFDCNVSEGDVSKYLLKHGLKDKYFWDRPVVKYNDRIDVKISLFIDSLIDVVSPFNKQKYLLNHTFSIKVERTQTVIMVVTLMLVSLVLP